jgi:hypothetical protein
VIKLTLAAGFLALLPGDRPGGAQERSKAALRFSDAGVERAVGRACSSRDPFLVLDTFAFFRPVNIDDDLHDPATAAATRLGHGDLVLAIASASHEPVLPYQIDPVFNAWTLAADFQKLADDIESGRTPKPAAVVSSIVLPVDLADVNALLDPDRRIAPEETGRRKAEIRAVVTNGGAPANPYALIDAAIARLRARDIPLFVAAGNAAPATLLNALALSEGAYAVGALDFGGGPAPYTSMPGMVALWSPGAVVVTETAEGLSVTGGRGVELKGAQLPEQKAVLERFVGKRARDVVRALPREVGFLPTGPSSGRRSRLLARLLEPGVYRTEDLMAAYGHSPSSATFARAIADGPYMHYPSDTIFAADADGSLNFDPLGDGAPGQLRLEDATSFAAPNICAENAPYRLAGSGARQAALR